MSSLLWDTVCLLVDGVGDVIIDTKKNSGVKKQRKYKKKNQNQGKNKNLSPMRIGSSYRYAKTTTQLERLIGSNIALFTDICYMKDLRQNTLKDLNEKQKMRIKERMEREKERQLDLIMRGVVDMAEAPSEFHSHPIYKTVMASRKRIEKTSRKANRHYKRLSSKHCRNSGLLQNGTEKKDDLPEDWSMEMLGENPTEEENNLQTEAEDEVTYRYEPPEVKKLRELKTVEELYSCADEIIGTLHAIKHNPMFIIDIE